MVFSENFFTSGASPDNPSGPGGGPPTPGPQYPIGNSLRFRGKSTSANTPKLSNANMTCPSTFTYSVWAKFPQEWPAVSGYATLFNQDGSGGGGYGPNLWLTTNTAGKQQFSYYVDSGKATSFAGDPEFNDPSAWYHIVFTSPTHTLYINGVAYPAKTDITLGTIDNVPFQIGSGFEAESWDQMDMILADMYFIDGQELSPTVFAEYNQDDVWQPIEPNFGKGQSSYSDGLTSSAKAYVSDVASRSYVESPGNAFNGNTSDYCSTPGQQQRIYWKPLTTLTGVTSLRVNNNTGQIDQLYINGVDASFTSNDGPGWVDLTSTIPGDGNISEISFYTTVTNNTTRIAGVEVNGVVLTDPYIWSAYLTSDSGWESVFLPTNAFDGSTGNPAIGSANGGQLVFAPTASIHVSSGVWVYSPGTTGGNFVWNSTTTPHSVAGWNFLPGTGEISVSNPVTFTAVASAQPNITAFAINDQANLLVDGINGSFGPTGFHLDFNDPNNPGKDVSGNENDFTANGDWDFVLKRSGDYLNPSSATYDQANNTIPTLYGGPPYMIDVVSSGTEWCASNVPPGNMFNGITDGPGNSNGTYCSGSYAEEFSFDLRDFPVVTNVAVWSGWNQSAGGGTAAAELLDENKNVIAGTRVNLQRHNNFSVRYELTDTEVPARYIHFDFTQADSSVFIYGIEVNYGMLYQGDDFNPQYDLLHDSPTNNLPSFNPLWTETEQNLFSGNLAITTAQLTGGQANIRFPVGMTGKYYFEAFTYNTPENTPPALVLTNQLNTGILPNDDVMSQSNYSVITNSQYSNFSDTSATSHSATDKPIKIMAFGLDFDNQELRQYVNGELVNTDTTVNFNSELAINVQQKNNAYNTYQPSINFGQYPFYYEKPDGFTTLGARNLEDGDIVNGREHFQVITGQGDGADGTPVAGQLGGDFLKYLTVSAADPSTPIANAFSSAGESAKFYTEVGGNWTFAPDPPIPVGSKVTIFQDNSQGTTTWNGQSLQPNQTSITFNASGEISAANPITSTSAGTPEVSYLSAIYVDDNLLVENSILTNAQTLFPNGLWWIKDRTTNFNHQLLDHVRGNLALQSNTPQVEQAYSVPGDSVAWCWKAGDSIVTNNDGTIESQVSANTKAGFSIVSYTGNLTAGATVGHGLDQAPEFFIVKARNFSQDWHVGAPKVFGSASSMLLNAAGSNINFNSWNGVAPDNSVITLGPVDGTNKSGEEYIAYCWHQVLGYCKINYYYGNGDTFGPYVHTGFKPAFVMIKSTGNAGFGWFMNDTTRKPYNPMNHPLTADSSAGEGNFSSAVPNFLSNGFRLRGGTDQYNKVNQQYLYIAFAENPFSSSVTAR